MGKEIITRATIDAPPAKVWQVLTDFGKFSEWNKFLVKAEGKAVAGEPLTISFANGMSMTPRLLVVEQDRELRWAGKLACGHLFDGEHRFILKPAGENGQQTELEHAEKFSGILIPLLSGLLRETEENFNKMNVALGERCKVV